ncbi:hypothetical protein FACUT_13980 [Fusarium acutatum]|uniref:Uncharacterized protein n=1 Tax=Fusarium acutatum TaxID=78861 RepID=A0A8H4NA83_9HYPO|nr:hypothetical protein FACUT_13980 [Fusarium acutatum]
MDIPTVPAIAAPLPPPFDQVQSHLSAAIVSAVDQAMNNTLDVNLEKMRTQLANELTVAINVAVNKTLKNPLDEWEKDRKSMAWRLRNIEAAHQA